MRVWLDAESVPDAVRQIVFRAVQRGTVPLCVVAGRDIVVPRAANVTAVRAGYAIDAPAHPIPSAVAPGDIVITADVTMATTVIGLGAVALDPAGHLHYRTTFADRLRRASLAHSLTWHAPESPKAAPASAERQRFAAALDRILSRRREKMRS